MKNFKKVLALMLCAVLLVGASVAGTLAYLTSTDTVTNTFTVGNVTITLDESEVDEYGVPVTPAATTDTGNEYKLIPGHTYTKNPTIHVGNDSENCWLFVKIENGLGANATINGLDTCGWTKVDGTDNYYAYKGATVGAGANVTVFDSFTYATSVDDTTADAAKEIVVTAYAIQADGFATSELAWVALANQVDSIPDVVTNP